MQDFHLIYSGSDISNGMSAATFVSAVSGFSRYYSSATSLIAGDSFKPGVRVKRLTEGSLDLQFAVEVFEQREAILGTATSLIDLLTQGISLVGHLKGEPPASRSVQQGNVTIENNSGEINVYNVLTENLVLNLGAANDVERFVRAPLRNEASEFEFRSQRKSLLRVDRSLAASMLPLPLGNEIISQDYEQWLTIIRPVLDGPGKWSFSDGKGKFFAVLEDDDFLEKVAGGQESFANGDEIYAKLRATQHRNGEKLSVSYSILKVIEHRRRKPDQERLIG